MISDRLIALIAEAAELLVPSRDKRDSEYSVDDIVGDLRKLYHLEYELRGISQLVDSLTGKFNRHRYDVKVRIEVLDAMLKERLGAV